MKEALSVKSIICCDRQSSQCRMGN